MKRVIFVLLTLISSIACKKDSAPPPEQPGQPGQPQQPSDTVIEFHKLYGGTLGDDLAVAVRSSDGGYLFAGVTFSTDGDISEAFGHEDIWILKLDSAGNKVWARTYGGSNTEDVSSIVAVPGGGYVVAAMTDSPDMLDNMGVLHPWIFKIDEEGNVIWEKTIGGFDFPRISALKGVKNGGFIGCGHVDVESNPWLFRLNESGDLVWHKRYGTRPGSVWMVDETPEGDFVIGGQIQDSVYSSVNMWAFKVDENGTLLWEKEFGGSGGDHGQDIVATSDNGALMTGVSLSTDGVATGNHGNGDILMAKLDASGNIEWHRMIGGMGPEYSRSNSLVETAEGHYMMAASSGSSDGDRNTLSGYSDGWIVEIDGHGNLVEQKTFGGASTDALYSIIHIKDGTFLATGSTASSDGMFTTNKGDWDGWVFTFKFNRK